MSLLTEIDPLMTMNLQIMQDSNRILWVDCDVTFSHLETVDIMAPFLCSTCGLLLPLQILQAD